MQSRTVSRDRERCHAEHRQHVLQSAPRDHSMRLLRPADGHRRDRHHRRRGQSLVEFAIVLPIMLFLTVIALDFGRVYLGWINLQSMSRIAANLAANNPTAWQGGGDAAVQAKYQNQIRNDAAATNCQLPTVG